MVVWDFVEGDEGGAGLRQLIESTADSWPLGGANSQVKP